VLAVNVAELPAQMVAELTLTIGKGLTVKLALHDVVQPLESVTVTEYVPVAFVVRVEPVEPSLHKYV
jgi:hypothetical protein